jgi:hypothetical protein
MIERAAAGAGLELRAHPHMLRHACGYALANKGTKIKKISSLLWVEIRRCDGAVFGLHPASLTPLGTRALV